MSETCAVSLCSSGRWLEACYGLSGYRWRATGCYFVSCCHVVLILFYLSETKSIRFEQRWVVNCDRRGEDGASFSFLLKVPLSFVTAFWSLLDHHFTSGFRVFFFILRSFSFLFWWKSTLVGP